MSSLEKGSLRLQSRDVKTYSMYTAHHSHSTWETQQEKEQVEYHNFMGQGTVQGREEGAEHLRIGIGGRVECSVVESWSPGVVVKHNYRESTWSADRIAPYQVQVDDGDLIFAPIDDDRAMFLLRMIHAQTIQKKKKKKKKKKKRNKKKKKGKMD